MLDDTGNSFNNEWQGNSYMLGHREIVIDVVILIALYAGW